MTEAIYWLECALSRLERNELDEAEGSVQMALYYNAKVVEEVFRRLHELNLGKKDGREAFLSPGLVFYSRIIVANVGRPLHPDYTPLITLIVAVVVFVLTSALVSSNHKLPPLL